MSVFVTSSHLCSPPPPPPPICKDVGACEVSISDLLREEAGKAGLVASERWMAKVEQLFTVAQHRHGEQMHALDPIM